MAQRVFIHIGLPKTATTYLQTIMWGARDQLRAEGVLLPGAERRDHLWASRVIRAEGELASHAHERARTSWQRLRDEIAAWSGTAIISHEFFAAASAEQAAGMIAELAPAEVHIIATAREPLGLFAASWQESIKNRDTTRIEDYSREVSDSPSAIWNWRTLDLRLVLERWSATVAPEHVHVLPLPGKGAPREEIWHRFAGVLGLDSHAYDLSGNFPNESLGVVEAETLRRINEHMGDFNKAFERGVYIRTFLADERLVPRKGERFWPSAERIEDCRERGRAAAAYVVEQGFDLIGSAEDLLVPEDLPERRHPDTVTDAEVADVAVELVARIMQDVRDARQERRRLLDKLSRQDVELARLRPVAKPLGWAAKVVRGLRRTTA